MGEADLLERGDRLLEVRSGLHRPHAQHRHPARALVELSSLEGAVGELERLLEVALGALVRGE